MSDVQAESPILEEVIIADDEEELQKFCTDTYGWKFDGPFYSDAATPKTELKCPFMKKSPLHANISCSTGLV